MPSPLQSVRHWALIPRSGFSWLRHASGRWTFIAPPEDWPHNDYLAAQDLDGGPRPVVTPTFFLAANADECWEAHRSQGDFGELREAPDLYLTYANERLTPKAMLGFANAHGFLRYDPDNMQLAPKGFFVESAREWLSNQSFLRGMIASEADMAGWTADKIRAWLDHGFNYSLRGSLTFQVRVERQSRRLYSELTASSLASLMDVQWGLSVAGAGSHLQCRECSNWFAVHPGRGRSDKQFCSPRCRLRAYRGRINATVSQSDGTEKTSPTQRAKRARKPTANRT